MDQEFGTLSRPLQSGLIGWALRQRRTLKFGDYADIDKGAAPFSPSERRF